MMMMISVTMQGGDSNHFTSYIEFMLRVMTMMMMMMTMMMLMTMMI